MYRRYNLFYMHKIRLFLIVETIAFLTAAFVHMGWLLENHVHEKASIAERVIAAVLFLGLCISMIRPAWTFKIGVVVQTFALLGTLVGLFTISVGVGPQTLLDIFYHIFIAAVLFVEWSSLVVGMNLFESYCSESLMASFIIFVRKRSFSVSSLVATVISIFCSEITSNILDLILLLRFTTVSLASGETMMSKSISPLFLIVNTTSK